MLTSPWLTERFDEIGKIPIRILIVADGLLSFNDTADFGLNELVDKNLRPSAFPWEDLTVTTAHRLTINPGEPNVTGAEKTGFRFDTANPPVTTQNYDQVWLFGQLGDKEGDFITASELKVLSKFMNDGGGVFATGDHEDLGAALCGKVPRVRSMRKWFIKGVPPEQQAPRRNDATRIDTLRIGIDADFQRNDEADHVPQEIRPVFTLSKDGKKSEVHKLLARGTFAVTVLPDHMHEGECMLPRDLNASLRFDGGDEFQEFPPLLNEQEKLSPEAIVLNQRKKLSPEVVAVSTSAGGYLTDDDNVLPVFPRCYYIIVAYDGHSTSRVINGQSDGKGVGRVVVDSSFHHFVNRNLKGTGSFDPERRGFYDANCNPTEDYLAIKHYFRNLITWLSPPEKQASYYANLLLSVRYLSPLAEEIRPTSAPSKKELLYVGASTRKVITETLSQVEATHCALFAAHTLHAEIKAATEKLFAPSSASDSDAEHFGLILDTDLILNFVLGGAMHGIAENLSANPVEAFQSFAATDAKEAAADTKEKRLESFIAHGVGKGLASLSYLIEGSNDALKSFSTKLNTFLPLGSSSIKGGKNMQSESGNPDAQAVGRCHINGNGWRSIIVRIPDREGFFHLGPEGPGGAFEGIFIPRSGPVERVRGTCLGDGMEIFRPKDSPIFRYEGKFEPDPNHPGQERVRGTRTLLTNLLDELNINQDQLSAAFVPDEWIADKGT